MKKIYLLIATATSLSFATTIGLLKNADKCPNGEKEVVIRLDTEDDSPNNSVSDSEPPKGIEVAKTGVKFTYCVHEAPDYISGLPKVPYPYVVLRLDGHCPNEAKPFARRHDTEDDDNNNWTKGDVSPSVVDKNATLEYCFVPADENSQLLYPFSKEYGVFANPKKLPKNVSHSKIYIDDEDDQIKRRSDECTWKWKRVPPDYKHEYVCEYDYYFRNNNQWVWSVKTLDYLTPVGGFPYVTELETIMSGDENTTYHVIKWNGKTLKKEANMVIVDQAAPAVKSFSPEIRGFDHSAVTVELKSAGNVNISIVNLKGAVVANISRENLQPGFHSFDWHSGIVPNGRYIVTVKQNGMVAAKNVILK